MTSASRATRHVIVGGGTAGINAITAIRQTDAVSEVVLVGDERPYARMVLPYYLWGRISESHVYTAIPPRLAQLAVRTMLGRRAVGLDVAAATLTLDDGATLEYDNLLIATGSSAVRPPIPGAAGERVFNLWTLEQCRGVLAALRPGMDVVLVGAGFIASTILNALLARGARLTVLELAPQILPRMVDRDAAAIVEAWLVRHGVQVRTGVQVAAIEDAGGRKHLSVGNGESVDADLVVLATGIRPNLGWLDGAGVTIEQGILVDDHLRSNAPNVYAAGDVAAGRDRVSGKPAIHAIEPTAVDHGRVAGVNMAGRDVAYPGSVLMNIVDILDLEIASFGDWSASGAETTVDARPERWAYRKIVWDGDRVAGAVLLGPANDVWTTNDVGMLKGLVQSGRRLGDWRALLARNPWDLKRAYVAAGTVGQLLPEKVLP